MVRSPREPWRLNRPVFIVIGKRQGPGSALGADCRLEQLNVVNVVTLLMHSRIAKLARTAENSAPCSASGNQQGEAADMRPISTTRFSFDKATGYTCL